MSAVDDIAGSFNALFDYTKELELLIALLVARAGTSHEGGYRICINDEDVACLVRLLGTEEPVVLRRQDVASGQLVVDVL